MKCNVCGAEVKEGSRFCYYCGSRLADQTAPAADVSAASEAYQAALAANAAAAAAEAEAADAAAEAVTATASAAPSGFSAADEGYQAAILAAAKAGHDTPAVPLPVISSAPIGVAAPASEATAPAAEAAAAPAADAADAAKAYHESVAAAQAKAAQMWGDEVPAQTAAPAAAAVAPAAAAAAEAAAPAAEAAAPAVEAAAPAAEAAAPAAEAVNAAAPVVEEQKGPRFFDDDVAPIVSTGHWLLTLILLTLIPIAVSVAAGIACSLLFTDSNTIALIVSAALFVTTLIMMFIWAFNRRTNPSKRNFFRAYLIYTAIMIAVSIILTIVLLAVAMPYINQITQDLPDMMKLFGNL